MHSLARVSLEDMDNVHSVALDGSEAEGNAQFDDLDGLEDDG